MKPEKASSFLFPLLRMGLIFISVLVLILGLPVCAGFSFWFPETKGPYKNWMQVVDWDGDGDLDVIVSHTRWEDVDLSWAGIGIWVNHGDGTFELVRDRGTGAYPFGGFAAGAGDVDQDGDLDVFTQDFGIHLLVNQGGVQRGEPGNYVSSAGINSPPAYNQGYRDVGGTIEMGDLNGDGLIDAFVAGCCYGLNARKAGYDGTNAPSLSWVWINDTWAWMKDDEVKYVLTGHILPMDSLDGRPIRQAALGDLDGDGDLDIYAALGKPTLGTIDSLDDLVLLNDGTGRLVIFDQQLGDTDSTSVALGDVNGDERLDALVGTNDGARLWINQSGEIKSGEPIFIPTEQTFMAKWTIKELVISGLTAIADKLLGLYLPYGSTRTMAVFLADLDGDNDLDALLARLWGAEIWWNDGQGEFRRSDVRFGYREDTGVAVADFDGDGDHDIFIGRNEDDYQVWWNDGRGTFLR